MLGRIVSTLLVFSVTYSLLNYVPPEAPVYASRFRMAPRWYHDVNRKPYLSFVLEIEPHENLRERPDPFILEKFMPPSENGPFFEGCVEEETIWIRVPYMTPYRNYIALMARCVPVDYSSPVSVTYMGNNVLLIEPASIHCETHHMSSDNAICETLNVHYRWNV